MDVNKVCFSINLCFPLSQSDPRYSLPNLSPNHGREGHRCGKHCVYSWEKLFKLFKGEQTLKQGNLGNNFTVCCCSFYFPNKFYWALVLFLTCMIIWSHVPLASYDFFLVLSLCFKISTINLVSTKLLPMGMIYRQTHKNRIQIVIGLNYPLIE